MVSAEDCDDYLCVLEELGWFRARVTLNGLFVQARWSIDGIFHGGDGEADQTLITSLQNTDRESRG